MSFFKSELAALGAEPELESVVAEFLATFEQQEATLAHRIAALKLGGAFVRAAAVSEYFCDNCLSRPHLVDTLLSHHLGVSSVHSDAVTAAQADDKEAVLAALRAYRHLHMMRIIWRECGGLCEVDQTLIDLSTLADRLIRDAVSSSFRMLTSRYGKPTGEPEPDQLMVLAMGKLGGMELNMSSDVDLVFLHTQSGATVGGNTIEHNDFFTRQTRSTVDLLARSTADGFVYRVDTRLRPFGRSGRPCLSLAALEQYLLMHGREWERYAYIKHRPVTPGSYQAAELDAILKPFVYRKYLDFGVFENLRDMKSMIAAEVERKDMQTDIKRGPGGIRELEFMVQTVQLVYGGKHPGLQCSGFFAALEAVGAAAYFDPEVAHELGQDYRFLRRLENGLQAARDQQVHKLPEQHLDQQRLTVLMGYDNWPALDAQIRTVRARVQLRFNELNVAASGDVPASVPRGKADLIWRNIYTSSCTENDGTPSVNTELFKCLQPLGDSGLRGRLDTAGRDRLDQLMPQLIDQLVDHNDDVSVARSVVKVVEGIGRRSAYFALLNENPPALRRLVSMCRQSARLADQLAVSPMLLDTLVDPRGSSLHLTRHGLKARFDQQFGELDPLDDERCLMALREFRQTAEFDVAIADFEHQLPVMKISDRLTEIAELILAEAMLMAECQMQQRYGIPRYARDPARKAEFTAIGYGKLGGLELAYGSDLDLVFLFDDGGDGNTDGQQAVDNTVYFSRLAQRLIHILTVRTAYGELYEVDMRLRPSGRSGLLVSRFSAFEKYQREQAWTWEHQALLRARGVAGDSNLLGKFEALRCDVLRQPRDSNKLCDDVCGMRAKMKANLDRSTATEFDLKHGPGGLTDLEFLVQYLVLDHATARPELITFSDNVRQIDALQAAGIVTSGEGDRLQQIYLAYRQRLHHLSLADSGPLVAQTEFTAERARVCEIMREHGLIPSPPVAR